MAKKVVIASACLFADQKLNFAPTNQLRGSDLELKSRRRHRVRKTCYGASGMIKRQRWQIISSMADVKSLTLSFAVEIICYGTA